MIILYHSITSALAVIFFFYIMGVIIWCGHRINNNGKATFFEIFMAFVVMWSLFMFTDVSMLFTDWLKVYLDIPCYQKLRCL